MPSKLMRRKIAWARQYAAAADEQLKILSAAQRAAFRGEYDGDRRQLALARGVIETDRTFQMVAIKDGRSPGNRRQSNDALKRYDRAVAEYARHTGREPSEYGGYWQWRDSIWSEIEALIERLRPPTTEEKT